MLPYTPSQTRRARIDIVSHDTTLTGLLRSVLDSEYTILTLPEFAVGNSALSDGTVDAVILDIGTGCIYRSGVTAILNQLLAHQMPVIIMADDDNYDQALEMVEQGAYSCVRKPPAVRELKIALRQACEGHALAGKLG